MLVSGIIRYIILEVFISKDSFYQLLKLKNASFTGLKVTWKVVGDRKWFRLKAFLRKRIIRRFDAHHRGGRRGRRRTFPGIDKRLTRFSNPCDILMCLILYVKTKREFQTAFHSFMWLARVYFWKNGNPSAPWASPLVTDIEILEMSRSGLDRSEQTKFNQDMRNLVVSWKSYETLLLKN